MDQHDFQGPFAAYGAVYALIISREDPQSTLNAVKTIVVAFLFATVVVLIGAMMFSSDPMLRFFWVVGIMFVVFFALSAMTNYTAAARFGYLVVISIPLWDQQTTAENKVEGTLWAVWTITVASLITAGVELVFAALRPSDDLLRSLDERLTAVEEVLRSFAAGGTVQEKAADRIAGLALLGTSRLRRVLQRSAPSTNEAEQMGATVALVGRLVDIAATLKALDIQVSDNDRKRIQVLADNVAHIRADLVAERIPRLLSTAGENDMAHAIPLLQEMERTVSMIPEVFTGSLPISVFGPEPQPESSPERFFVPDAFSNPHHLTFGLRGCLAASLCYVTYNLLAWPGISTSVTTCLLTALTTVGASRQKQVLRFTGALAGGAIGMASQVLILPNLDSIYGFTLLFLAVTVIAAWITTSGPRLSYFGVQLAVAFYLINLVEFKIQTSLAVARDRVVGILLGLLAMWLVFDQLWGTSAAAEMRRTFISVLRSLAQLAKEPLTNNLRAAIERSYSLREAINRGFNQVRALGDGVLLEFGPSRAQDLVTRSQIIRWQSQLRMIFITRVSLLKYRLELPGFELPEQVRLAQREFDDCLADTLNGMAARMEGSGKQGMERLESALTRLEETINRHGSTAGPGGMTDHLQTFIPLSRRIETLAVSLDNEI